MASEGNISAVFLGWTSFDVARSPLWPNFGSSDELVVPGPDGKDLTLDLSEYAADPAVVVSMGADRLPTDVQIYDVRTYAGSVAQHNDSGAFLLLMDNGHVGGIVRMLNWSAEIRNTPAVDADILEIGWTSNPVISSGELGTVQFVIEEPDFSHCGDVHVSKIRYDVDDGVTEDNPDYFADLTEMHELSRLNWDDICIDLDMWQIVAYDFNTINSNACSTDAYRAFLDDDWGNPNLHTHQLWTALDLAGGCVGIASPSSLRDNQWGASVVEGLTVIPFKYNAFAATSMSWVSTHELGHNHGSSHYDHCNVGTNWGCNRMYPSIPWDWDKGDWWTTASEDQIRNYAYPRLD